MCNSCKYLFIVIILALIITSCGKNDNKNREDQKLLNDNWPLPDYVLNDVIHYHYEDGYLKLKVEFESGYFYNTSEDLYVENSRFVYYDINRKNVSKGSSRKAKLIRSQSELIAEDNVIIISEINGCKLETEYLEWHEDNDQFNTDRFVKITRPNGDILTGVGLIADVSLQIVTIKSDVKGSFKEK